MKGAVAAQAPHIADCFRKSESSLLLRYLVWSCDDPATFLALAQVNRYCAELAREHRGMKKVQFSRKVSFTTTTRKHLSVNVLPNGSCHGYGEWTVRGSLCFCVTD